MYLLKQIYNKSRHLDDMYIYQFVNKKWLLNEVIQVKNGKGLFEFVQSRPIQLDYAIIKINQPYRNILYHFYPHIKIIIDKHEIIALFNTLMGEAQDVYEEVAVSIEQRCHAEYFNGDIRFFIHDFYHMQSKTEAIAFYELWQKDLPINDKKISKFVRVMEFYSDEIINYFDSNRGTISVFTDEC